MINFSKGNFHLVQSGSFGFHLKAQETQFFKIHSTQTRDSFYHGNEVYRDLPLKELFSAFTRIGLRQLINKQEHRVETYGL